MNPGEETVVCPYNKAHVLLKSRLQFHLTKCRKDYPHSDKAICPFNSTHIVNKVELENHMNECPDRGVIDNFLYGMSDATPAGLLPVRSIGVGSANNDDNWDEDPNAPSVLTEVANLAKTKEVLIPLVGASKSERKAHRRNERMRHAAIKDNPDHRASEQYRASPAPAAAPAPVAAQAPPGAEKPKKVVRAPPHIREPTFFQHAPQASSSRSAAPVTTNPWFGGRSLEFPTLGGKGARRDDDTGLEDQMKNMSLDSDRNERPNVWAKPAPRQHAQIPVPAVGLGGGNRSRANPWGKRTQQLARPAQSGTTDSADSAGTADPTEPAEPADLAGPAEPADPTGPMSLPELRMPPFIMDDFPTLVMGGRGRGRKIKK